VRNAAAGVEIEAEGTPAQIDEFEDAIRSAPPPQARIDTIEIQPIPARNSNGFEIRKSDGSGDIAAGMPPDLAICDDCTRELLSQSDRRYRYPFINCTNCGPRFTIIESLPYDRPGTTMAPFRMCAECSAEYHDPLNRRFDAQPNACPRCGPRITLLTPDRNAAAADALCMAQNLLRDGCIGAVKGLGGFHLCCLATDDNVVLRLRKRKKRPHKPLAVMFRSLDEARAHCDLGQDACRALLSPARPIVIAPRRPSSTLSVHISPDTGDVGVFLPYTPLHVLLLESLSPLVMTSANRSEEPIAHTLEALGDLLGNTADFALDHDRRILRRCDDSVLMVHDGAPYPVRRSRGFVPQRIALPHGGPSVLAAGAELKSTFCVTRGSHAFVSQHIGDLTDLKAVDFYREAIEDLQTLLGVRVAHTACDMHPDYLSTRYAEQHAPPGTQPIRIQHHHAHMAACMVDNGLRDTAIGVTLDGTGYGPDNTIWGGEILVGNLARVRRAARLAPVPLPGGDHAVKNPWRMAFSYLLHAFGEKAPALAQELMPGAEPDALPILMHMIRTGVNAPLTSSAGRLFDAVGALLGLCSSTTYEAQAAIRLQKTAEACRTEPAPYTCTLADREDLLELNVDEMIRRIVHDVRTGKPRPEIARAFHSTLSGLVAQACRRIADCEGIHTVLLSGGVFQNTLLLGMVQRQLCRGGLDVYIHRNVPCNDAGVSLGQAAAAAAQLAHR
jgi:hydrogenase maturation protein HypF